MELAELIKANLWGCTDAEQGRQKLWDTVKNYVETHAVVTYSWAGIFDGTPDPLIVFSPCTISTSLDPGLSSIVPQSAWNSVKSAVEAMTLLSQAMNSCASTWLVQFPLGVLVSPALVLPTITLAPLGSNDGNAAMDSLCSSILSGLSACTPEIKGTHGVYTGAGVFTNITIL